MPRTKRKFKRKRYGRSRKRFRRRTTRVSRWGITKYNIHKYRRYARPDILNLPLSASGEAPKAMQFSLDQVSNYTELTALYDSYKINYVKVIINWSPKQTLTVNPNAPGQSIYPVIYWSKDYDDATTPSTLAQLRERGNLRQTRITPNRQIVMIVKPAVSRMMYKTATTTGYGPGWNTKIDCSNPDVPHFGLKMIVDYLAGQSVGALNIQILYHLTMYGTR